MRANPAGQLVRLALHEVASYTLVLNVPLPHAVHVFLLCVSTRRARVIASRPKKDPAEQLMCCAVHEAPVNGMLPHGATLKHRFVLQLILLDVPTTTLKWFWHVVCRRLFCQK